MSLLGGYHRVGWFATDLAGSAIYSIITIAS
jgi:hypothetical protein